MTSTSIPPAGASTEIAGAANRDIAVDFLRQAASGHALEVMRRHAAPDFVHHNPYFVAVHSRVQHKPDDAPVATVHIFRFEAGRIAELWDLGQEAPADSPNQAGMF